MERRNALLLPVVASAAVAMPPSSANEHSPSKKAIYIYAPADVVVSEIFVSDGNVGIGKKLLRLSSIDVLRFRSRLQALNEMVEMYERPFKDGRMDDLLTDLKAEAAAAKVEYESRIIAVEEAEMRYKSGAGVTFGEVELTRSTLQHAKVKMLVADTQLAHEPRRTKDVRDKLALARKHLKEEEKLLSLDAENLTVTSPVAGRFWLEVGKGSFVKKGIRIGGIEL